MPGIYALIVAAGRGSRAGEGLPKQYRTLGSKTVLRHSIEALQTVPAIEAVHVVIHPDDRELFETSISGMNLPPFILGGAERQDSVRLGLEALIEHQPDQVLIHDAARPFASRNLIEDAIKALDEHIGVIPGLQIVDTIKRTGTDGAVGDTVDRTNLYQVQTPQAFRFREILAAHEAAKGQKLTDDAAVAEFAGHRIFISAGSAENFKLTTSDDFRKAENMLAASQKLPRCGNGFDVHRFCEGDHVMLCGVKIPHSQALAGHSDADVALHALTDALLGAIAAGDIGSHFPPTDPQWKGASSDRFLAHASHLIRERGGQIVNVDVTLICQAPKVGPHREAMAENVARILDIPADQVSVKATTTEKLGFTGRKEGIAAQASAMVLA